MSSSNNKGAYGVKSKGNAETLQDAHEIQDKTEAGLNRIDATVASAKEIGTKTVFELEDQRRQMESINEELSEFDGRLARARALLYQFGQGLLNDRIFQFFLVMNAMLTVAIIFVILDKRGAL